MTESEEIGTRAQAKERERDEAWGLKADRLKGDKEEEVEE